jgi:two-component system nitrogen regulation response regulator GlnG
MDGTILVADDDRTIRTVLTQALTRAGCRVHATGSAQTLMRWVEEGKGDLVISDVIMPDGNGLECLPRIRGLRPSLPVIVISAQNTMMTAIQAAEADAYDYLPKPFDLPDLMRLVGRGLDARRLAFRPTPAVVSPLPGLDTDEMPLVGRAPVMQAMFRLVARVVNAPMPVLLTGETGTGKSLIARAIHDLSDRRSQPFVTSRPEDLVTLGGLEALIQTAGQGTLVLDALGEVESDAQGRLARIMDRMDSSNGPRLLAISSEEPARALADGRLREDIFYRFSALTLTMPPLRDRGDDVALLTQHFLHMVVQSGAVARAFTPDAMKALRGAAWPGNVRQLEYLVRRLVVTSADTEIGRAEVEANLGAVRAPGPSATGDAETLSDSVARHLQRYFDRLGAELPPPGLYDRILAEVERPLIEISLAATAGNQLQCADLLGINRNTLRKKITDLGIHVARRRKLM